MLIREEYRLLGCVVILAEKINGLAPGCLLDAIDLTEIEHVPLNNTVISKPTAFDHAPVAVFFAILESF